MPTIFYFIIALAAGIGIGVLLGSYLKKFRHKQTLTDAEAEAKKLIGDAEAKHTDVLQRAKEKAIAILEEARKEEKQAMEELKQQQRELLDREKNFQEKLLEIDTKKAEVEKAREYLEEAKAKTEDAREQAIVELEKAAAMNKDEALEKLLSMVEAQQKEVLLQRMRKMDEVTEAELSEKARNVLATAIQRQASSHVCETTTTYVELPTEEMKGRIIGREGRNIKAIELLTGCELIVDETPNVVTISGFSPIRRQVAKRALNKLIADGRIHPGRIEETVDEAKRELVLDIKAAGEDALQELGIPVSSIDPKLLQILGRLKYRTSYGQNALLHSLEVAKLSALIAEELGADVAVCRKGGLLHDVGKAVDHDMQGSHPELGYKIMKKFGLPEEICYQSIGHHEDKPKTVEAIIVKAADAISGARPGARKDSLELYVKRLEELERVASDYEGVEKVYAIQAGREIRVFVNPREVDDYKAEQMAKDIAQRIESELKYPGEIRITLIRETRVTEHAR